MNAQPDTGQPAVDFIPLGGIGEFGMNMHLLVAGDTALLIDAGVMFPEPELFGVDLVIPDFTALEPWRGRVRALVLTHGHEDHIGAVAHVLPYVDGPIYGTAFTLALLRPKLAEHGLDVEDRLVTVAPRQRVDVGPVTVEFLRVPHSIPDCIALALQRCGVRVGESGCFDHAPTIEARVGDTYYGALFSASAARAGGQMAQLPLRTFRGSRHFAPLE